MYYLHLPSSLLTGLSLHYNLLPSNMMNLICARQNGQDIQTISDWRQHMYMIVPLTTETLHRQPTPTTCTFQNDIPVSSYFNLETGLILVLPNGWQSFVNFRAMVGNEQFNNYAGTFGLRLEL